MTDKEYARAERRLDLGIRIYKWLVVAYAIFVVSVLIYGTIYH
jgi:hypothetical protein